MLALFAKTKLIFIFFEIITCEPSIYRMDQPDIIICSFMENSIGLKRFNILLIFLLSVFSLLFLSPVKKYMYKSLVVRKLVFMLATRQHYNFISR